MREETKYCYRSEYGSYYNDINSKPNYTKDLERSNAQLISNISSITSSSEEAIAKLRKENERLTKEVGKIHSRFEIIDL